MRSCLLFLFTIWFCTISAFADCNDLLSGSPVSRARTVMARGLREDWTFNDYHQSRVAILSNGRVAWGQLARVLWRGPFGQHALTIQSMAFSGVVHSPSDVFLKGDRLEDFIKTTKDLLNFVLESYARRRKWPPQFLEQLWNAAFDYIDESVYITSSAGEISEAIGVNTGADKFLRPFYGDLKDTATIRLAAEREGKTIMENLLNVEIPSDANTLKVEPGNLNILPVASEPAKAQLAVGILTSMEALKAKFNKANLKFVTYTDDHALPIYSELGFQRVKPEFFKDLKSGTFEVDQDGFVKLLQFFPDGSVLKWTPLTCEESRLRETAWMFINAFRQKYGDQKVKKDLDRLVSELESALKTTPELTTTVVTDHTTKESYPTKMVWTDSMFGFKTRTGTGFRGIRHSIPSLKQGEIVRFAMTDDQGQDRVGQLVFDQGILEFKVYPWHEFEPHDWGGGRRRNQVCEESAPILWTFRAGPLGLWSLDSSRLPEWMEFIEYDSSGRIVHMEGTWLDKVIPIELSGALPRLSSLIVKPPPPPQK